MDEECLLYRWDSLSSGPLYFVVPTKKWEKYERDENERVVLARGTWEEMNQLLKLFEEN